MKKVCEERKGQQKIFPYEDFNKDIMEEGEPIVEHPGSKQFRDMIWMIKTLTETICLSKRFRIIMDYDPERKKMLIRKYYQTGEVQSIVEGVKDNTIL